MKRKNNTSKRNKFILNSSGKYIFNEAEKKQIERNSKMLTDPIKEKNFVDYLKYLADK